MNSSLIKTVLGKSLKTSKWILSITLPTSLIVTIASHYGFIEWLSLHLSFIFKYIGLPGEASIIYLTSVFLPLYTAISLMFTIPLTLRDVTILTSMCLIAHNMPVESGIQKKIGMPIWKSISLRITVSILCAALLNQILPSNLAETIISDGNIINMQTTLLTTLSQWGISSMWLCAKIIGIVTILMFIQELFKHYNLFSYITKPLSPLMRIMGLKAESTYLWIIAQVVGLAYSAGIIAEESKNMEISKGELKRLNLHIAINHSLLEDTTLFLLIGVQWWWIIFPKMILAIIIVWLSHAIKYIRSNTR